MPSRKSNVSTTSNGAVAVEEPTPSVIRTPRESLGMSVEDLSLPRTMISRLSKGVLPPNTQIQKDALTALSKSATVFVNYIASSAMENASGTGKRTIQPQDVLVALKDSEFDFMIPRIEAELKKYNTVQCNKRNSYRRKVKADKAATGASTTDLDIDTTTNGDGDNTTKNGNSSGTIHISSTTDGTSTTSLTAKAANGKHNANGDSEPPTKKIRRDGEGGGFSDDDEDGEGNEDEIDEDEGAEDPAEDDEGEVDEDEEMEEMEDEDEDEVVSGEEGGSGDGAEEPDEDARIQRQIERDEALDEGGESD